MMRHLKTPLFIFTAFLMLAGAVFAAEQPALWGRLVLAENGEPTFNRLAIDEVLASATKQEVAEFRAWVPAPSVLQSSGDSYLLAWVRLNDNGVLRIADLEKRRVPVDENSSLLLKTYKSRDGHRAYRDLVGHIATGVAHDPYDIGVIRRLALVPMSISRDAMAALERSVQQATGIYAEEMVESALFLCHRLKRGFKVVRGKDEKTKLVCH